MSFWDDLQRDTSNLWNSGLRTSNNLVYGTTGYDFLGLHKPDYYGSNIQRQIASTLSTPRQSAYDAMAQQLAREYAKQREQVNISAMNRGLAKSGFTAEQERELAGQEALAKSMAYAKLLQDEQNFLDQLYMQNKDIALKVALQERNEALQRQIAFTNAIATIASAFVNPIGTATAIFGAIGAPV